MITRHPICLVRIMFEKDKANQIEELAESLNARILFSMIHIANMNLERTYAFPTPNHKEQFVSQITEDASVIA